MMFRFATTLLFLFLLCIVEAGFFSALPHPWRFTPLVFASAVYVIQHMGSRAGVSWLVGYGLFLDLWKLGVVPGETVLLLFVGFGTWILSRRIFTNRSLYGVVACALISWISWHVVTMVGLMFINRKNAEILLWSAYPDFLLWQGLLLIGLITLFFFLSGRIRRTLRSIIMIPTIHETL